MTKNMRFYAVLRGYKPGIYQTLDECLAQVTGFRGSVFKSFLTEDEARLYLAANDPSLNPQSSFPPKFYGVRNGKVPGVYLTWEEAREQAVDGTSNPKWQCSCFGTLAEAEAFVTGTPSESATTKTAGDGASPGKRSSSRSQSPPLTKRKTNSQPFPHPTTSFTSVYTTQPPLTALAINSLLVAGVARPNSNATHTAPPTSDWSTPPSYSTSLQSVARTMAAIGSKPDISTPISPSTDTPPCKAGPLRIYTDGSKLESSTASNIGLWFGPNDPENTSSPPHSSNNNNNNSESLGYALMSVLRALEIAPAHRDVLIHTSNSYAISYICLNWKKDGSVSEDGQEVAHKDLLEGIQLRIREREEFGVRTGLEWITDREKEGLEHDDGKVEEAPLEEEGIVDKVEESMT